MRRLPTRILLPSRPSAMARAPCLPRRNRSYDSRGRVVSRETTTGSTTTIYDAGGRNCCEPGTIYFAWGCFHDFMLGPPIARRLAPDRSTRGRARLEMTYMIAVGWYLLRSRI